MTRFSFERYLGQYVRIELDDGREFAGELIDIDANGVVLKIEEEDALPVSYFRMAVVKFIDFEFLIADKEVEAAKPGRLLTLKTANA